MVVSTAPTASLERLHTALQAELDTLQKEGRLKGAEFVTTKVIRPAGDKGPRYHIQGYGDREFLKMNSNSYLGMSLRQEIIDAEESAALSYGAGPGAVRFISGTFEPHIELEKRLAEFHGREAGMIFSSAYSTVMGVLVPLITKDTAVISDELNHNCIINAVRLSRPQSKAVYPHLDMAALDAELAKAVGTAARAIVVTDGIFSMRGDNAALDKLMAVYGKYDEKFPEGVISVVDDSHGVGAFGQTGRGTEEYCGAPASDVLIATLGKALGVNGGYVVSSQTVVEYLRETAPMYIYSNPITPSEASAALKALEILDSAEGRGLLDRLRARTKRFEAGLVELGYEIIPGEHPVVPLMVRDTARTSRLVRFLVDNGILATGLNYPVVPKGDEEIRFQISADHTEHDIDYTLDALRRFKAESAGA